MELAQQRGLDVCPSLLTGWFLGNARPFFFDRQQQDQFYTSAALLAAVKLYFAETAQVLAGRPNFLGFDIGNEMNVGWSAHQRTAEGDAWLAKIMTHLDALCPRQVHSVGVDHGPWFQCDTFSPQALTRLQKIVPLHCYIKFTGALDRGSAMDPPSVKLIAGMAALARAYANDPAKPIWVQEFGASAEWIDRKLIPRFMEQTVQAAMGEGVSWFTWYSSHNTNRKFAGLGLDYDLGLLTGDYRLKDEAHTFQSLARQYRGQPVVLKADKPLPPPPASRSSESTWKWLAEWIAGCDLWSLYQNRRGHVTDSVRK